MFGNIWLLLKMVLFLQSMSMGWLLKLMQARFLKYITFQHHCISVANIHHPISAIGTVVLMMFSYIIEH